MVSPAMCSPEIVAFDKALKGNLVPFILAEESCTLHALEALLAAGHGWGPRGNYPQMTQKGLRTSLIYPGI